MGAEKAYEFGLATRVIEGEVLTEAATKIADRLASGPTVTLGLIRHQVNSALKFGFDDMLKVESQNQNIAGATSDVRDSLKVFNEGLPPVFTGK